MAAKDSGEIKKQEIDDGPGCCLCTQVYTESKTLPCIHTFCMKCLQETGLNANKGPGDEMPCPICRQLFKIPPEGFHGLPKYLFIERLMQVVNISVQVTSSIAICDACVEENSAESDKEIPAADTFCVHCNQKFCEECCRQHSKFKLTKNHKLIPFTEHEVGQNVMTDLAPSVCELHEQNVLNVYCADCKTVVCAICFIEEHKKHDGAHVNKFVDGFRKQIESNAEAINRCRTEAEAKKAELLKMQQDIQKRVETLECDVEKRKDELKQFIDKHATSLLQGLRSIRQSKLKEIEMATGDIDTYLLCLDTYSSYCQKTIDKRSASDICGAFSDLSVRVAELQNQCQPMIEREIESFHFSFRKSEFEEFLEENSDNLIGEIKAEENESKPWRRKNTKSQLTELSSEIDLLRKEVESEKTNRENLILANEELRNNTNKEIQANKALTEELSQEKAHNDAHTKKLKQELETNKITNNTLRTNNKKLKEELDKEKVTNNLLQASNNKLVHEVNTCKTTIRTLEDNVEKLKQELETIKIGSRKTILNLEEKLKQEQIEKEQQTEEKQRLLVDLRYKSDPVLVQTIRSKAAEATKKSISGLTILNKEMFAVRDDSSEVEVYDSMTFSFSRQWNLKELINPRDIGSCNKNKCLYIFSYKGHRKPKEILRVDPNGTLIKKWSTGDDWGWGLSVTDESNVILTAFNKHKLNEYSPDGQLIREIDLSYAGIRYPNHAIKLTNGHFVVSHGSIKDDLHRVCVVDADGKLKKSFGAKRGSTIGQMHVPVYLSVDGNGFVMVADQLNRRALLLNPDLEFKKEILPKEEKHGLLLPWRILLDESNDRLFVADNESNSHRIFIFDFK